MKMCPEFQGDKVIQDKLQRFLKRFRRNDRGAVTVDWVVITAGVVSLGIAVLALIGAESEKLAVETGQVISSRTLK